MTWKETLNGALTRATGYELQRAGAKPAAKAAKRPRVGQPRAGDRLVQAPVFVICTLRSGSTLLRVLLDSHSQIHSPHELHLRYVSVNFDQKWSERSMSESASTTRAAEYLLWDRLLQRELAASGKAIIVNKTPERRVHRRPAARVLAGREASSTCSATRARSPARGRPIEASRPTRTSKNAALIRRYCEALEAARADLRRP